MARRRTRVEQQAERLKALGHPIRLGIAQQLAVEQETCACDFADVFGVSQPTISGHLRVMRHAGLVTTRRRGTQIFYALDPAALRELRGFLSELTPAARAKRSA
jgi:DNA-binding transcriptional ArsR family regulator